MREVIPMESLSKERFARALDDAIYSLELSAKCYRYEDESKYKDVIDYLKKALKNIGE